MRKRSGTNPKQKSSIKKSKNNEDNSYNYYSSSPENKTTKFNEFIEFIVFMKKCLKSLKNSFFRLISKLSFLSQSIFFKIPIIAIILLFLGMIHIFIFEKLYFKNYYNVIKKEYLNKLTNEIDKKYFELDTLEIKKKFDEAEELLFFNIYFKELIDMGLAEEKDINKDIHVFNPIQNELLFTYAYLNNITNQVGMNNNYELPIVDSNNYFFRSNSTMSEFAKLYFFLLPSITIDQINQNKFLNQSFLISYEYNDKLNEIEDNKYFYFVYPKSNSLYSSGNNFHPGNIRTNPNIYKSNKINFTINNNNNNNDYNEDNWFSKQDFIFRNNSDNINKSIISFQHLNYNYFGKINKTFIISLQCYFQHKNKKIIINIINFYHQNNYTTDSLSYSLFLLNNNSNNFKPLITEKYSDNETFVINQNDITEVSMSNILNNYFHYGFKDIKNNFYSSGISYDNYNLNIMGSPALFYNTFSEFYQDTFFMAPIYFYGKFFQKSEYNTLGSTSSDLKTYEFYNEDEVEIICKSFNFSIYISIIKNFNINCDILNNEKIVSIANSNNNSNNIPYCGCLALNCLDQTDKKIDEQYKSKKYNFVKKIKLPERCLNYLFFYEEKKSNNVSSLIKNIMDAFLGNEQKNYITFKNIKDDIFPGLSCFVVIAIDNTYLINVLSLLVGELTMIEIDLIMVIIIWVIILLIISIVITVYQTKRFSALIYDFSQKYDKYIYQLEASEIKENMKNQNDHNNSNLLNPSENTPLLSSISRVKSLKRVNTNFPYYSLNNIQNSNPLLNEIFNMFCQYYRLDNQKLIKYHQSKTEKSKKKIKEDIMNDQNELFELFVKLSSYESRINFSMIIDFYSNSPIIKEINQLSKKGKIINKNEEKSTKDVIYELLSTENVYDTGLVTNFNFGYISYLNLDEFKSVKNALFNRKEDSLSENFNLKERLKSDQRKNFIKLLLKNKNVLYSDLQKYYDLDEIKYDKIESCFNQFLLKIYYKYLKKIIEVKK